MLSLKASFTEISASFAILGFFFGWIIGLFDATIYGMYEGRLGWPKFAKDRAQKAQERQVARLQQKAARSKGVDKTAFEEAWYRLRNFPLNEAAAPHAESPTRLGNLLKAYEQYSLSRYGMDGVFYWYRIRMLVTSEESREMDNAAGEADAIIYMSFALLLGAILYVSNGIAGFSLHMSLEAAPSGVGIGTEPVNWLGLSIVLLALSYGTYRLGLPLHRAYGEFYKSMFDLGRSRLIERLKLDLSTVDTEKQYWEDLFYWLWYLQEKTGPGRPPSTAV